LEHTVFDAFFETERSCFAYERGHSQISSFGFGGTNGHCVFWGRSVVGQQDAQTLLMKRIAKMSPAEIRPVGNNPDDWEADLPEANPKPGDVYSIVLRPDDPMDEPIKWVKVQDASEQKDSFLDFYTVTGNFNNWQQDTLAPGAPGQFTITVFAPAEGKVDFRFLLNGDESKVVAPEKDQSTDKLGRVLGPQEGLSNVWSIEAAPNTCLRLQLLCLANIYSVSWMPA